MENNNGRGIFYGVIGVATLIVAIIGATFAYFASAANGTAFNATAANISLTFNENNYMKTDLIPVETGFTSGLNKDNQNVDQTKKPGYSAETARTTFASSANVGPTKCNDGTYNICSIYDFTITNPGTVAMPINISFNPTSTIANLKYAVFRGKATEITSWDVNGSVVDAADATTGNLIVATKDANEALGTALDITLAGKTNETTDSVSYTIIVWIEEVGEQQNASGTFTGSVNIVTGNGQGITGKLA